MKNNFAETLKEMRIRAGYSQKEVYEMFNIRQSTFSAWETGRAEPSADMLLKLCKLYNINDIFAAFGYDGYNDDGSIQLNLKEIEHIEKYRSLDQHGQETVSYILDRETERMKQIEQATPATVIELSTRYGSRHLSEYFRDASAGGGIFILGNETASKIAIPDSEWDDHTDYVIRVNGDSMMPDFQDGDNVMVSQRVELHHGDVGIFVVNGKAYIKEYGAEELISRNPDSQNIPIHEYDNIVCMGKVIGKLGGEYEIIND